MSYALSQLHGALIDVRPSRFVGEAIRLRLPTAAFSSNCVRDPPLRRPGDRNTVRCTTGTTTAPAARSRERFAPGRSSPRCAVHSRSTSPAICSVGGSDRNISRSTTGRCQTSLSTTRTSQSSRSGSTWSSCTLRGLCRATVVSTRAEESASRASASSGSTFSFHGFDAARHTTSRRSSAGWTTKYIESGQYVADLFDIRFLRTQRLNQELSGSLLELGYEPADVEFVESLKHAPVSRTQARPERRSPGRARREGGLLSRSPRRGRPARASCFGLRAIGLSDRTAFSKTMPRGSSGVGA